MHRRTTLDNGLRIVSTTTPHTRSVCLSIFVGAGSRYEDDAMAGASHFIEHLVFKGTRRRPSAKDISEAIEGVGGILNAATDRELTVYWCKVARPHFPLAVDILVDMLRFPVFDPAELEKERQVVLEELNAVQDSPHQLVDMLIDQVLWPDQALGRDVAGTKDTVAALARDALLDYMYHQYTPGNAVVSVAGDIEHEEVVASLSPLLGDWQGGSPHSWYPAENGQGAPRWRLAFRKTEQAHLCLGVPGLSSLHADRYTLDLLNIVLGEGMSSRLFVELRERRGLAYDIHSYVNHFLDSGSVVVYAGVDPRRIEDTIGAILEELDHMRGEIAPEELAKAREFAKGRLLLRMEDTRSVAGWMGSQELLTGRIQSVDEVVALVDAIATEDVERVARQLLTAKKLNLAVVGPFRSGRRFQSLLHL